MTRPVTPTRRPDCGYGRDHLIGLRGACMRVLLVEDDDGVARAIVDVLGTYGHRVHRCCWGADALLTHREADLVLLDLGLPDMDGLDLLRKLRRITTVPVVVLTARDDERSVVRGLRHGADDYVVKPIRLGELLARIEAVVRRSVAQKGPEPELVRVGDVCVDLRAWTVEVAGRAIRLTGKEFEVLAVLARNLGSVVSRERIMDEVWGDAYVAISRSLDVHISGLRAKLGRPELLRTIRGLGYRLG